jgi:hypothetical protein
MTKKSVAKVSNTLFYLILIFLFLPVYLNNKKVQNYKWRCINNEKGP